MLYYIEVEYSMTVNNVTRMLAAKKIPFEAFETPEEKLGALETASFLNVPPEVVYKTIVVLRPKPGKNILAIIPGPNRLDLKLLASGLGEKKLSLATEREAEQVTGLQTGGISPLALVNKGFQVILDESASSLTDLHVSAGQRGLNVRLPVKELVRLVNAQFLKISSG